MEPLLAVRTMAQQRWERNERGVARDNDEATAAELEEEARWDAGTGEGGAFGDKNKLLKNEGLERTVFEFRGEDDVLDAKKAGVSADEAFPTPATLKAKRHPVQKREGPKVYPERVVPINRTKSFRFVDISSDGVEQTKQVQRAINKREKASARRKIYRKRTLGIYE